MAKIHALVRRGAYHDSVVLMQPQKALMALPEMLDADVVMGIDANKQMLQQSHLLTPEAQDVRALDFVIAARAESDDVSKTALGQVYALIARHSSRRHRISPAQPKNRVFLFSDNISLAEEIENRPDLQSRRGH